MSSMNSENIYRLLTWIGEEKNKVENLTEQIRRKDSVIKQLSDMIEELEKQHKRDLCEKELMLADVDSVVQRSETAEEMEVE